MIGSQNIKKDILLAIYSEKRTVFRLNDIAVLICETNFGSLNNRLNYYVRTGKLLNPRKGIYARPGYNIEELACTLYTPSYISLQYVLQRSGVIFQYDSGITSVSYLTRNIEIGNQSIVYRKIRGRALVDTDGITRQKEGVNIATAERAFLDMLYLEKDYYFDNLSLINKETVYKLLPLFQSKALDVRVKNILQND